MWAILASYPSRGFYHSPLSQRVGASSVLSVGDGALRRISGKLRNSYWEAVYICWSEKKTSAISFPPPGPSGQCPGLKRLTGDQARVARGGAVGAFVSALFRLRRHRKLLFVLQRRSQRRRIQIQAWRRESVGLFSTCKQSALAPLK